MHEDLTYHCREDGIVVPAHTSTHQEPGVHPDDDTDQSQDGHGHCPAKKLWRPRVIADLEEGRRLERHDAGEGGSVLVEKLRYYVN